MLMQALTAATEAIIDGQRGEGIAGCQSRIGRCVSANLCRALSRLI